MRIVNTDDFDGDYPDESFLLWPMTKADAQLIADAINRVAGMDNRRYWKVVEDDYVLQPGFEP